MNKVVVTYTAEFKTTLNWPDNEMGDFTLENLQSNITPSDDDFRGMDVDIIDLKLNGEDHYF
jgi:hypothetical protein